MGLWLAMGVAVFAFATALADVDSGLRTWWTLRGELRDAQTRIAELRAEVSSLERAAGGLEDDPFALERAIRERLEYARPGETIVRYPERSSLGSAWLRAVEPLAPRSAANHRIP